MVEIRDALNHELNVVREQRVKAYEEHKLSIPSAHWEALHQAISSDADIDSGAQTIVAEFDGEIVGSVVLCSENTDAYRGLTGMSEYPEIRMLAVATHARNKGIAKLLINECVHRAKKKGIQYVGLHTADFMKNAVRLYEQMGFKRVPEFDFEPANDGIIVKAYRLFLT